METTKRRRLRNSVQLQFAAYFMALTAILLLLLNTFPIRTSRNVIFSEKQNALSSRAAVAAASLSPLDALTRENTRQVMGFLELSDLDRVIITDPEGAILFDTVGDTAPDKAALEDIKQALSGETVFCSSFDMNAFRSRAAQPVRSGGRTLGAVLVSEVDTEQAQIIVTMQSRLATASIVIGLMSLGFIFLSIRAMTRRITQLSEGLRIVRSGDYSYRLALRGHDELTELGSEINNLTERLQTTEAQRRRFVSDASHELKTPLASIRLLSDSILQSETMDTETMRDFVTDIGAEAERLQRTTEKLLDLSRRDDGVEAERTDVDLAAAVDGTLRMLRPLAESERITIRTALSPDCLVRASEDDIYHIIFNLVENAIKYNLPDGSVTVTVRGSEQTCTLLVEDTGIGIPEADRPNIFARFYRVDKARSRASGGSGLGLSIVHDAVTLYGGTVEVDCVQPHGTRFTVTFPRADEGKKGTDHAES